MNQAIETIAVAAKPTISPRSAPGVDEHLRVVVGLASQIQVSDKIAPRLKDESNHVGNHIVASGGLGLEWMAGVVLERAADFRLESVAGFIRMRKLQLVCYPGSDRPTAAYLLDIGAQVRHLVPDLHKPMIISFGTDSFRLRGIERIELDG